MLTRGGGGGGGGVVRIPFKFQAIGTEVVANFAHHYVSRIVPLHYFHGKKEFGHSHSAKTITYLGYVGGLSLYS